MFLKVRFYLAMTCFAATIMLCFGYWIAHWGISKAEVEEAIGAYLWGLAIFGLALIPDLLLKK